MEYLEDLPPNCPLAASEDISVDAVYRVVRSMNPGIDDFLSNAALRITKPPTVDDCKWASCSLFKSRDKAINIANKLAKTRIMDPHLSLCDIKVGYGKSISNSKAHVDFWPYRTFDPAIAVLKTEKV